MASFIYFIYVRDAPLRGIDPTGIAFYTPVTRFWEFGFGILTALAAKRDLLKFCFHPFFAIAAWTMLAVGLWQSHTVGGLSWGILLVCLGTALLIAHGSNQTQNLQTKALGSLPLVWLGDRSYSIYLWHWPLLILSIWVFPQTWWAPLLAMAFTVLLSMASYSLLEQRIRLDRLKSQVRNLTRPALVFATSIAWVVATSSVAHAGWYVSPNSMRSLAQPFHESPVSAEAVTNALEGCATAELSISCEFFDDAPYIAVIGDSLGYRSFPAVALSAKENGFNAEQMWTGGCSIELESCPDFVYEFLSTHKIAGIVVAVNYDRASALLNGGERAAGEIAECKTVALMDTCQAHVESVEAFTEAAAPGLRQLEGYPSNLLVALPFPQQEILLSSCLNPPLFHRWLGITEGTEPCGSTSVAWQLDRQGLFPGAIDSVATGDEHVTLWNPIDYLCFEGNCPAVIEPEELIMDDAIHWSPAASRFLYPAFNEFISTLRKVHLDATASSALLY